MVYASSFARRWKSSRVCDCCLLLFLVLRSAEGQPPAGVSLFFSEYAEGEDSNRYVEIFSSGPVAANLEEFKLVTLGPQGEATQVKHDLLPVKMRTGSLHIVSDEDAQDPMIEAMSMQRIEAPFDGSTLLALVYEPDGTVVDVIGSLTAPLGQCATGAWDVCGVEMATRGHTLARKRHVTHGNGGRWAASAGTGLEDCEWNVYSGSNTKDIASHTVDSLVASANRTSRPLHLSELHSSAKAQLDTCPRYRPRIRVKPRKRIQIRLTKRLKASPYLQGYLRANPRWRVKTRPRYVLSTGKTVKYRPILVAGTSTTSVASTAMTTTTTTSITNTASTTSPATAATSTNGSNTSSSVEVPMSDSRGGKSNTGKSGNSSKPSSASVAAPDQRAGKGAPPKDTQAG